jgi:hypothetical protein
VDRRRGLSAINAEVARPRGLTSGSTRWLTSRAVGHVAASGLCLSGEQKRVRYCRRFDPGGSLDRRVKLSLRVPAQMGWREMEHKGGEPRLVLSCAQGGCACSRGYKRSRGRERASLFVGPSSRATTYEGPEPSFYRCKERVQVYNGGVAIC